MEKDDAYRQAVVLVRTDTRPGFGHGYLLAETQVGEVHLLQVVTTHCLDDALSIIRCGSGFDLSHDQWSRSAFHALLATSVRLPDFHALGSGRPPDLLQLESALQLRASIKSVLTNHFARCHSETHSNVSARPVMEALRTFARRLLYMPKPSSRWICLEGLNWVASGPDEQVRELRQAALTASAFVFPFLLTDEASVQAIDDGAPLMDVLKLVSGAEAPVWTRMLTTASQPSARVLRDATPVAGILFDQNADHVPTTPMEIRCFTRLWRIANCERLWMPDIKLVWGLSAIVDPVCWMRDMRGNYGSWEQAVNALVSCYQAGGTGPRYFVGGRAVAMAITANIAALSHFHSAPRDEGQIAAELKRHFSHKEPLVVHQWLAAWYEAFRISPGISDAARNTKLCGEPLDRSVSGEFLGGTSDQQAKLIAGLRSSSHSASKMALRNLIALASWQSLLRVGINPTLSAPE